MYWKLRPGSFPLEEKAIQRDAVQNWKWDMVDGNPGLVSRKSRFDGPEIAVGFRKL